MSIEDSAGLGVNNVYGPRTTNEARASSTWGGGAVHELRTAFHGSDYDQVTATLPDNATVIDCYVRVKEAFALTGTSPTLAVGTSGSAATNGVKLTKAQAEAVGTYELTPAGSWANPLPTKVYVAVELGGTSPVLGEGGEAEFVIRYATV